MINILCPVRNGRSTEDERLELLVRDLFSHRLLMRVDTLTYLFTCLLSVVAFIPMPQSAHDCSNALVRLDVLRGQLSNNGRVAGAY